MTDFTKKYADFTEADRRRDDLILKATAPICSFDIVCVDGTEKRSDMFAWQRIVSVETELIDYPNDGPVSRFERTLTYTCAELGLSVTTVATRYENYPVVEFASTLCNLADGFSVRVKNVRAADAVIVDGASFTVHYNVGSPCTVNDYKPLSCELTLGGQFRLGENSGRPTSNFLQHFNFEKAGEGRGVIAVLSWQGNWKVTATGEENGIRFAAGQSDTDFVLQKGESFRVPLTVLMYYRGGDWQEGQNLYRRWILEHNLMRHQGRRDYRQNLYLCSGFRGAESDLVGLEQAELCDFGTFRCTLEYDAGWYHIAEDSDWWRDAGNWYPADCYGKDGLLKISEKARGMGWVYSMWFEPERCLRHTKTAQDLTDGVIYIDGNGQYLPYDKADAGTCGMVDYGNEKSLSYITDLLDGYFTEYEIELYRQDHNFDPAAYWHAYDVYQAEQFLVPRTGVTENHSTTGYLALWEELVRRHPKLIFDCCAGGGRRYDIETERFGFAHTKSDCWLDETAQQCQNFGFYSWHHFGGTAFTDRDEYDIRTRLTLSIGVDMAEGSDYASSKAAATQWAVTQKYLLNDFYQLTPYDDTENGHLAMQFHDAERGEGMMVAYLRSGGEMTLLPRGLDSESVYTFRDEDKPITAVTATGACFMKNGFAVSYETGRKKAVLVWYKKA